ncbi:MAG TPA: ATP-binding cassette domain-containing protein [Spirochaetota bacterium]|nr:ATP-binding cassette domain-containing protein [Spirochaetota bacterium]
MRGGRLMLEVVQLEKRFPVRNGFLRKPSAWVHAVSEVSFSLGPRESLGLVGESGSGKTTIGRCLVRMEDPTAGKILLNGVDLAALDQNTLKPWRRKVQYVFQDPYSALNPRMKVGASVAEGLHVHTSLKKGEIQHRVEELLQNVGLSADAMSKYPHEFSGGQRQRIAIARALILDPELLVLDEPVSALDVSVQAQILNLLEDIRDQRSLATVLISHNLAVVRQVTDRTAVLYLGRIVESGPTGQVLEKPRHPYTASLIQSIPEAGKPIVPSIEGEVPSNITLPSGCPFHPRCPQARTGVCDRELPQLSGDAGHRTACHFPLE